MPDISVIIATYNRAKALARTLGAMCDLDTAAVAWELLLADNNSDDDTRRTAAAFAGRLPLRYIFEPRQGKNHAVNAALGEAAGELVVMTDDDVRPCRAWLTELWRACVDFPDCDVFCGPVTTPVPEAFSGTLQGAVPTCNFSLPGGRRAVAGDVMPIGANLAFRRRALAEFGAGLFDPEVGPRGAGRISGSETTALQALLGAGHRMAYVPEAAVGHETPDGFRSIAGLCARAFAQGRGDARVLRFGGDCPRMLGVPRFFLRAMLEDAGAAVVETARGRRKPALHKIFRAARFLGGIVQWRRQGKQAHRRAAAAEGT